MNRRERLSAIERIFLWSQTTGWNIKSINLFPINRRASGHWQILLSLLLGAICQSCAPTDVHIRDKPAISAAAGIIRPKGPLASEFLEAAKLEGTNVAANRIAKEHYLRVALNAWVALKATRGQQDPALLEIHNQAIANYLQFLSPGDLAIGTVDEVVDGQHMRVVLRDEFKPDSPPGFDRLIPSERLAIRGLESGRYRGVRRQLSLIVADGNRDTNGGIRPPILR